MSSYRLVAYGWGSRGPLTLSAVYRQVEAAVAEAEHIIAELAIRPHKRPYRIDVVDMWTRETVTRVTPHTDRDPNCCPVCGAAHDPFASGDACRPPPSTLFEKSVLEHPEGGGR